MANTIELYNYTGLEKVIRKNITLVETVSGEYRSPLTLMNPTYVLAGSVQPLLVNGQVNYLKVANRFYHVIDWSVEFNGLIQVNLHLDVLMTYKDIINDLEIMLERSSTAIDPDIADSQLPLSANKEVAFMDFPRGFSENSEDGCYMMVTSQNGYTKV